MGINYYSILHLKRHCTKDDVHKAFGKLIPKYSISNKSHDCNLITLCEAYEVLSDSFLRAMYDKYGEEGIKKGIQSENLYYGPWTYHGDVITTYSKYCAIKNPISHLYIKSNGSALMGFKNNEIRPDIVNLSLKLTLNEIFNGVTKLIEVKRKPIQISDTTKMPIHVVKVKIPQGFPTGGTLKSEILKADIGFEYLRTLYMFTTEDIPHKDFKRDNANLIMIKNVTLKQVLFGLTMNIKTLDHKVLRVNITQVITNDYVKKIYNEGMPDMNDPTLRGDIIIKFNIIYPLYLPITDQTLCQ